MRIAHLTATFPPNWTGAGNTCLNFARRQAADGHEVEVFTADAPGEAPDPGGAIVHRYHPRVSIGNAPLIRELAQLHGFDLIHLHYPFIFGVELLLAGRLRDRKAAVVVGYKNELRGKGLRRPLFWGYEHGTPRLLMRHADRICILSDAHAESVPYLRAAREREPSKLVVMPNGVDAELFSPGDDTGVRARFGVPEDAVLAVFVATLDRAHHFKRVDLAIEAVAATGDERLHLLVVGDGDLLDDYKRLAAEKLGERAHFAGAVPHDELPALLRAGDLFVLTTEPPESFGIVLIEAMACGLPVVATEYPGVTAVVDDGVTGLIASRGDVPAAAQAISRIVEMGPEGRHAMGVAGRAKCEREWAWPSLVERMDGVYQGAIERRASLGAK